MNETNEEVIQKLKQAICDYFMGYVKQKLKFLLVNGKEDEIVSLIMQFLDAQFDTQNFVINKENIIGILNSILLEGNPNSQLEETHIANCFPTTIEIYIEDGLAAFLTEVQTTPLNETLEKSYYLYVAPDYYSEVIRKY